MNSNILTNVKNLIENFYMPDRHSYFQLEKFLIGKETTPQAKMWAILREIKARYQTLKAIERDLRDAEDNIEITDIQIQMNAAPNFSKLTSDLERQLVEVQNRKLLRDKERIVDSAKNLLEKYQCVEEEVVYLYKLFEVYHKSFGELKPFDDYEEQSKQWEEKLSEELTFCQLLGKPISIELAKTILALGDDSQLKKSMETFLANKQNNLKFLIEQESKKLQQIKEGK